MAEPLQHWEGLQYEGPTVADRQYKDQYAVNTNIRLNVIDAHVIDGRNIRHELVDAIRLPDNGAVLDVGCADGSVLLDFAQRYDFRGTAVGIDIDARSVGLAERRSQRLVKANGPNLFFLPADMSDLPFEDASFDTIICSFSLHHAENLSRALSELYRVAKADAQILIAANSRFQKSFHHDVGLRACAQVAGVKLPSKFAERFSTETIGRELSPYFRYVRAIRHKTFIEFFNNTTDLNDLDLSFGTYWTEFRPQISREDWRHLVSGVLHRIYRVALIENGRILDNIDRGIVEYRK